MHDIDKIEDRAERTFTELRPAQVDQVGGGVIVPLPINPVVNWIIRKLLN